MKRMIIAAAAAGLLGLGMMMPAVAMPASALAPAAASNSEIVQVRHGGGHRSMRRGGRGHHYGWSRGRHRGHR